MKKLFYFLYEIYQPAAILTLRIILWGFDWVMPEASVEEGYEVISKYYGHEYRLSQRTAALMDRLQPDQQEMVFNLAWELRKCEREVANCIERAAPEPTE